MTRPVKKSIADLKGTLEDFYADGNFGVLRVSGMLWEELFPHDEEMGISRTMVQVELRDMGVFQRVHETFLLPQSYKVLAVYIQFMQRNWAVVVQSPAIPRVEEGSDLPFVNPIYTGSKRRGDLKLARIEFDSGPDRNGRVLRVD